MALRPPDQHEICARCYNGVSVCSCKPLHMYVVGERLRFSEYQRFWRCAHHPSAIDNFFAGRTSCGLLCHTQELEWYHGGERPLPNLLVV